MEKKKLNLETTLKKATIEMLLLNLLKEQDMYGYQLSQELKKRSSGLYTILEGSMYPILYRLNDSGYISFFEKKVGRRQTRIYYHLEDNGLMYLDNLQTSHITPTFLYIHLSFVSTYRQLLVYIFLHHIHQ